MCEGFRVGERARRFRKFQRSVAQRDGVFNRAQAFEAGLTRGDVTAGLEDGRWVRFMGNYILTGSPESDRAVLRAALLRAGPRAKASATSALAAYGLNLRLKGGMCLGEGIAYVSVPANRHIDLGSRVHVIRESCVVEEAHWIEGIPLVVRDRAVVDALRFLPDLEGKEVLYRTLQAGWISPDTLSRWVDKLHGKAGNVRLRQHWQDSLAGSHAESEARAARLLRCAGVSGWEPNAAVHDADGLVGYADFLFRDAWLVVEVDGRAWHSDAAQFQRDRSRQNRLVNAGYRVLRFTWEDLISRPEAVVEAIQRLIR